LAFDGFGCFWSAANRERGGLRLAHDSWHTLRGAKVKRATASFRVNNADREYGCSVGARL
jgi:hypothetical protein